MLKHFCDVCKKVIDLPDKDKTTLKIENIQGKPAMLPLDICVFCKEKIMAYLQKLTNEEV